MVRYKPVVAILFAVMLVLLLSVVSCLPKVEVEPKTQVLPLFTEAAATIIAQFTETAKAAPSPSEQPKTDVTPSPTITLTATLPPIPTLASTSGILLPCDLAQFIQDVTIPDGYHLERSEHFTKVWRVKNVGSCDWYANYTIEHYTGPNFSAKSAYLFPDIIIKPGQTVDLSVQMQAPDEDGKFISYWGIKNPQEKWIPFVGVQGPGGVYTSITVGTGKPKNTDTPDEFRVLSVVYGATRTGSCATPGTKYIIDAKIKTSKAGKVTYYWKRSDGVRTAAQSLEFLSASAKTVSYEWETAEDAVWVQLYIDEPNHQLFDRTYLYCP